MGLKKCMMELNQARNYCLDRRLPTRAKLQVYDDRQGMAICLCTSCSLDFYNKHHNPFAFLISPNSIHSFSFSTMLRQSM